MLVNSTDYEVQNWGRTRERLQSFLSEQTSPNYSTLDKFDFQIADYINSVQNVAPTGEPFHAGVHKRYVVLTYEMAVDCHMVPRFESDWLRSIREDPFCKLRPLQQADAANKILIRTALFERDPDDSIRTNLMAESLHQAEQYLRSARHVDISVKPLLVYYAAVNLAVAVLVPRLRDLHRHHGSHGLELLGVRSGGSTSLRVAPTHDGLFRWLREGLGGSQALLPLQQDWSLMDLLALVPELAENLNEFTSTPSRCQRLLDWDEHHPQRVSPPTGAGLLGPILPVSYLARQGVAINTANAQEVNSGITSAFPDLQTPLGEYGGRDGFDSPKLREPVLAVFLRARRFKDFPVLYPLLHQGGSDGGWYLVYNDNHPRPSQFLVHFTLLYALSMLVRYWPTEWARIIREEGMVASLLEEFTDLSTLKLPALATELLYRRLVLGSREAMSG